MKHGPNDIFDNRLIFGDNLLALKALEAEFAGKVKCVFIDPPYNTGSAFEHYDDGLEHSIWLGLMRDRLEVIKRLLSEDGSLWITIDDNEAHYLKVLCDEVFGRLDFVGNAVWRKKYTLANDAKWLSENHDHILVYARNKELWRPRRLGRSSDMDARYRNPDGHPKGPWKSTPLYAKRTGSEKEQAFSFVFRNGVTWTPPKGTSPRFPADRLRQMDENGEIWFGAEGPALKKSVFLAFAKRGWRKNEPNPIPPEKPSRFQRLCLRALSECAISESKAAELLEVSPRQLRDSLDNPPDLENGQRPRS